MASYSWVSIIALFSYLFLLLAFLAAKKTPVIHSFILLLAFMILSTGGSFLMRVRFWPSVNFWHYVSLLGILMVPSIFFRFFLAFLEEKRSYGSWLWIVFYAVSYVVNLFTQVFIPTPEVVTDGAGNVGFVYHYGWQVAILLAGAVCIVIQCTLLFIRYCRGDALIFRQLRPILYGLGVLVAGTILSAVPMLAGIPFDIISCILFAYILFYALYRKHLFRLTMLVSPANCYVIAVLIAIAVSYDTITPLQAFLRENLHMGEVATAMCVTLLLLIFIYLLYRIMKRFLDAVFVKEEQGQAETIRQFSHTVSTTLNKTEILSDLMDVLQKVVSVDKIFICLREQNEDYTVAMERSALHKTEFMLRRDHPLIRFLQTHEGCVLMEDFLRTPDCRSMWEAEKQVLREQGIACIVPMKDESELIGLVLLSEKSKGKSFSYSDLSLLNSVCSVCSMAVRNSQLYEKAYYEARRDELTGLYNRKCFYETAAEKFAQCRDKSLALIHLNLDDFKLYNQLYGTANGDLALKQVAQIINATMEGRGIAFRMAGKEFSVLLPGHDIYSARVLCESIASQVSKIEIFGAQYSLKPLTMSCGICAAPYMASTLDELIANTDFAVYSAKRAGKNQIVIYSEAVQTQQKQAEHVSGYDAYASTIYALTATIDTKDHYTFRHSQNVAQYAQELARECGMNQEFIDVIREAGLLHDIGKIGVREDILNKPDRLTLEEYAVMKTHVENSVGIIRHLPSLDYVIPAVISHHERYDGKGYPRGLAGEDIPLMGRMLCVADAFDAITSRRSYKQALSVERALEILQNESGKQFDPYLTQKFIALVRSGRLTVSAVTENPQ